MYIALQRSLFRFAQGFIEEMKMKGMAKPDTVFRNLDAAASLNELPEVDIIGVAGFGYDTEGKLVEASCSFLVMTLNDENLFRHADLMDQLSRRLVPESKITLYNPDTLFEDGWLKVTNMAVPPVLRSEVRPMQGVQVALATSLTAAR